MRLACLALLASTVAQADPDAAARAKKLFDEGRTLAKANNYVEACEHFEQSFALDAETGTAVNFADCLEHLGKLRRAWQLFDRAADDSLRAGNTVRAKFARDRATALEPKLATIVVHVAQPAPAGLVVRVGDHDVTLAGEIRDRVEPGDVEVVALAPDFIEQRTPVSAVAGASSDVNVELQRMHHDANGLPAPRQPTLEPPLRPSSEPLPYAHVEAQATFQRDHGRVRVAYIVGGAGIAIGAGGLGLALYAKHAYDNNAAKGDIAAANHDVHLADIATGFAIVSGACVATAAILYFTAPRERVVVAPTGNGVAIAGRF
jgi:tetratricopeptide (TPR) repeat protein